MAWSHPAISLDDLVLLVQNFVDMLILASGYQSSGRPATWDAQNIKKALHWGLFFEQVIKELIDGADCVENLKELDSALRGLALNPLMPQGLVHLSASTLSKARYVVLHHLVQSHPLQDEYLTVLLTATIEMDFSNPNGTDDVDTSWNIHVDKLLSQIESLNLIPQGKAKFSEPVTSPLDVGLDIENSKWDEYCNSIKLNLVSNDSGFVNNSCFLIQELLKRQADMSCALSVEVGLDRISKTVLRKGLMEKHTFDAKSSTGHSLDLWRSRCLNCLLDKRTVRMLSGAKLIFTSPKVQWCQIFEQLKISMDSQDTFVEIMEMLLLALISRKWKIVIENLVSYRCDHISISKQLSDLQLTQAKSQSMHREMEVLCPMERDILEYVEVLLRTQPKLWLLPPVLVAAAFPSWSSLFRMYLSEIERQYTEAYDYNSCIEQGKDAECEIAERIRCLYLFHCQD